MSALVTGAAGFIGSRVVARLAASGRLVAALDDESAGLPLPAATAHIVPVRGDIRDAAVVEKAMAAVKPRLVVHLAAIHHIPTCTAEPRRALDVNVVGTQTVLDAAARHQCGMVVIASSGAVYRWDDIALPETAPLEPQDTYALGKLANEHQLAVWVRRNHGRGRIARIFNAIGAGDPNAHLVPDVLRRLAAALSDGAGRPLQLPMGNTESRRDFIHVDDIADGLLAMAGDGDTTPLAAYNLCSGKEVSVRQLVERIAAKLDLAIEQVVDPRLVRSDDRPSQRGNPDLTAERLGWRARRSIDDALADIIALHWQRR